MHSLRNYVLCLLVMQILLTFPAPVESQSLYEAGDVVLITETALPVHIHPDASSPVATEILAGMKSRIVATAIQNNHETWFYLEDNAYGWVRSKIADDTTFELYSDDNLREILSQARFSIEAGTTDPYQYVRRGTVFLTLKRFEEAVSDYAHALELSPVDGHLHENLGKAYLDAGDYPSAQSEFERAIELKQQQPGTYNRLAITYLSQLDPYEAINKYLKGISVQSGWGLIYGNLANAYTEINDYDSAINYYNQALELDPHLALAMTNRALTYWTLGDYDNALTDFNSAVKIAPYSSYTYLKRSAYFDDALGDYDAARRDLNTALKLSPDNADVSAASGVNYLKSGEFNLAVVDLEHALRIDPFNTTAHFNIAYSYSQLGRYQDAIENYSYIIVGVDNFDGGMLLYRPQVFVAVDEYHNALADLNRYIETYGSNHDYFAAVAYLTRANIYLRTKNYTDSIRDYREAFENQQVFSQNYYIYGAGYRVTPLREKLIKKIEAQLAFSSEPTDYLELGHLYMELGRWQEAISTYNTYLSKVEDPKLTEYVSTFSKLVN
ncbi:MAG: tetratricopeptide repeat protein [Anaerolineae bacterium]